ncbi:MAG: hypothetical protein AUG88_01320 [Actinobacteria bacterium 13_1_20CM_4_68_12]|nr:MAG: hypothetical protein AUG88_01320 [Actinobacteria bacterium 13_1_20CM_4_68_12]
MTAGWTSWCGGGLWTICEAATPRYVTGPRPTEWRFEPCPTALVWLRERFESVVAWLSYPYGLVTPAVEAAAREAGYTAALTLGGGPFPPARVNRWAVPRENIPSGLSENGFVIRSSGL